ncbi:unnamed protein product [Cylindrotheca closterium]|uniref:Vacuolar protein sorting-associated protein 54 C-terminal domain-containing protein n=1 Tax=Cylindrotheca closterium TaxID=2856 RepID=A0AAD2PVU4_9STRA|nr:unnamed protein product [Cylindrotheca closterium]
MATTNKNNGNGKRLGDLPKEDEIELATQEAQQCIDAVEREGFQLDGFNLLGVVANPLHGMSPQSLHGRASIHAAAMREEEEGDTDVITDAFNSLGKTMSQVTEQIDTFNIFLEELSKEYLGDDSGESLFLEYYYQDGDEEEVPTPFELSNTSLAGVEQYIGKSGDLATSLFSLGLETRSSMGEDAEKSLDETPAVFSKIDFDLTDPKIFLPLLLEEKQAEDPKTSIQTGGTSSLYQPTNELLPLKDPDCCAGYLDRVELALQEQVRQKAGAFFQETTRFQQLQVSIEQMLQQVQLLRKYIQQISSVYRQTNDISSHQRQNYEEFVALMDSAMDLIRCKASIGGLLSANDYLGAAEQIQYGRALLNGEVPNDEDMAEGEGIVELRQLSALSTCGDQFQQYENLVIQNLSEELVDACFNWRADDKERVKEVVKALKLCKAMSTTGDIYQRRLQQTIRMTVRTTIAEFVESTGAGGSGVTGMTYPVFYDCLELLIEEIQAVLRTARSVDQFFSTEGIFEDEEKRWTSDALTTGADLAAKSIAELLRLRKEAHSLLSLDSMKQLWDTCMEFTTSIESFGNGTKAVGLRSTLSGQAKAFLDRTHESNMSSLVHALDSERWMQCEVSAERQTALTRLCTGRIMGSQSTRWTQVNGENGVVPSEKKPIAEVEGTDYKVVWSCLLLVEMVMTNLHASAHFQSLASTAVTKVVELLRLFNTRATHLVLGAGAIHSAARLKSINAKHLSMVTQCLGMMLAILPHIRAALMAQLATKQHALLSDLDRIKKDYVDHNEKVLNKFVTIIGGIVEHGLAPKLPSINFDVRARDLKSEGATTKCCVFLDGISTNTRKMHQVLNVLLPPDHLQDVFSRIFAFVDQKVPTLFIEAASTDRAANGSHVFEFPQTDEGKLRMITEVEYTTKKLNSLSGVIPWDFTAMGVLERKLDFKVSSKENKEDTLKHDGALQITKENETAASNGENELNTISEMQENIAENTDENRVSETPDLNDSEQPTETFDSKALEEPIKDGKITDGRTD